MPLALPLPENVASTWHKPPGTNKTMTLKTKTGTAVKIFICITQANMAQIVTQLQYFRSHTPGVAIRQDNVADFV
jgi:hypothetical protein